MVVMPLFFQEYHTIPIFGEVLDVASFVYTVQQGTNLEVERQIPELSELFARLVLVRPV
jgi:hypothetical protein